MDGSYPHVLVNHFPIILSLLGLGAAVMALATRRRTVWLYATATMVLAAATAVPTLLTGETAEEGIEESYWASRRAIHEHEEAGEFATYATVLAGLVSAFAWYRLTRGRGGDAEASAAGTTAGLPTWLGALVVVTALASAGAMARAGYESGFIRHKNPALEGAAIPQEGTLPRATEPRRGAPPAEAGEPRS